MPLLGQASGDWSESSSSLRLLHVGVRNSTGVLTDDAFTQSNPPVVATNISTQVDTAALGVLSGSVAFTRPDAGSNYVGGPGSATVLTTGLGGNDANAHSFKALGVFVNNANGNGFENTPGPASGKGAYISSQGTYGNALYETAILATHGGGPTAGDAITYVNGMGLIASQNGYLMPNAVDSGGAIVYLDGTSGAAAANQNSAEGFVHHTEGTAALEAVGATLIGVLKMVPDSTQDELVYDQRI